MRETETPHPDARGIDTKTSIEIVSLMHAEEMHAIERMASVLPDIARAAEDAAQTIAAGGTIYYAGAGTSGRLGVLDASEIPPTFGVAPFRAVIAGGEEAVTRAVEGAEDDREAGSRMADGLGSRDMAIGISAGGRTPFVMGFLERAALATKKTWLLTCSSTPCPIPLRGVIVLPSGPELIAGSTRLKAGTLTKVALNMISTAAMIAMGGVHDGLMVDVAPTNEKLVERALGIIVSITGVTRAEARKALEASGMRPKSATLALLSGLVPSDAEALLARSGGSLRKAMASARRPASP